MVENRFLRKKTKTLNIDDKKPVIIIDGDDTL